MTPRLLRSGELASVLPAGGLTLLSSCSAESDLFDREIGLAGEALGAIDLSGIFVPGLNRRTWQAGPASRVTSFFLTPELRAHPDRLRFLPLCYQDIMAFYRREKPVAALFMCAPPDANGNCSFGSEVGPIAALWRDVPVRIAHINPAMPRTPGHPGIPFAELTAFFEAERPLLAMAPAQADADSLAIADAIAERVPHGATLQVGIGKIPDAVLAKLVSHRDLRLHSGLIGDGALALVNSDAMAPGASALGGVAIGSQSLYDGLENPRFQFHPPTVTHNGDVIAAIDRLVTINAAMEIDLFGQGFSESSSRGFMSGPGGAMDFAWGARRSSGATRIIALPSRAGRASRIVPPGAGHGPVSLSRFDIDLVVTEHGVADLRLKGHGERAAALIAVAHPDHREALERVWRDYASQITEA